MKYQYCEAYGFDSKKIQERLRLFELGPGDQATAKLLNELVIEPNSAQIVYHFYHFLFNHDEFSTFLPEAKIDSLKRTQTEYLLSLGDEMGSAEYFDGRLRVGVAHSRIGMPLALYESAYQKLRTLILERIPEELDASQIVRLQLFTIKIISLDMSLALDSYMLANMDELEESVDTLRKQSKKYKYRSEIDPLTHALNRTNVLNMIKDQMVTAPMESKHLYVLMMDFKGLGKVNSTHGHLAGDYILKQAVERVCALLNEESHIGRFGGDEFLISLVADSEEQARVLAETIHRTIEDKPFEVGKHSVDISVNIGQTGYQPDDTLTTLLRRVDASLLSETKKAS